MDNPLRRSCVSSTRNAGESAICPVYAQPFAEIVRVEYAKGRRECDLGGTWMNGVCCKYLANMAYLVCLPSHTYNFANIYLAAFQVC